MGRALEPAHALLRGSAGAPPPPPPPARPPDPHACPHCLPPSSTRPPTHLELARERGFNVSLDAAQQEGAQDGVELGDDLGGRREGAGGRGG